MKARAVAHGRRCTNGHRRNRNRVETAPLLGASACRTAGPEPTGTVPNPGPNDRAARSRNSRPRQKADQRALTISLAPKKLRARGDADRGNGLPGRLVQEDARGATHGAGRKQNGRPEMSGRL